MTNKDRAVSPEKQMRRIARKQQRQAARQREQNRRQWATWVVARERSRRG